MTQISSQHPSTLLAAAEDQQEQQVRVKTWLDSNPFIQCKVHTPSHGQDGALPFEAGEAKHVYEEATHPQAKHTPKDQHSALPVVPPLNFDLVAAGGVYRSGHPNERNFSFLRNLKLKSIMYLGMEDYRPNMSNFAKEEGIRVFHMRLQINKEPFDEMDSDEVSRALTIILDPVNRPILIHCNKGKYRVGCIVGCLRKMQGWLHSIIFDEYARFAGDKVADQEFIETFDVNRVQIPPGGYLGVS